jgi:hypothetical protein
MPGEAGDCLVTIWQGRNAPGLLRPTAPCSPPPCIIGPAFALFRSETPATPCRHSSSPATCFRRSTYGWRSPRRSGAKRDCSTSRSANQASRRLRRMCLLRSKLWQAAGPIGDALVVLLNHFHPSTPLTEEETAAINDRQDLLQRIADVKGKHKRKALRPSAHHVAAPELIASPACPAFPPHKPGRESPPPPTPENSACAGAKRRHPRRLLAYRRRSLLRP